MSTKIVPSSKNKTSETAEETKDDGEPKSTNDNTAIGVTAAFAKDLKLLEEADDFSDAREKVNAVKNLMKKIESASKDTTLQTQTSLSMEDFELIHTSLQDFCKIKVEYELLLSQKSNDIEVEVKLLERMKHALLNTMDKNSITTMFMAFGANPKRRRSGKHKSMLKQTADQLAIDLENDHEFKEALKLFPSDPEKVKQGRLLLKDANTWSKFDIWKLRSLFDNSNILATKTLVAYIFEDSLDLLSAMKVDVATFGRFVGQVCDTYNAVPYHNCLHGADVMQGYHSIIYNSKLKDSLSSTLKFAALTAALVHDIGHPGRNNKFLIDCK